MARSFERFDKLYMKPDPRYQNELASKFINSVMEDGKKHLAQEIFYKAIDKFESTVEPEDTMEAFEEAVENVKPQIEVRSRRVGGATYQVPMEVPPQRKISLALRWIMDAARTARDRQGIPAHKAIADELIDAYNNEGTAIKRRHEVHRMAEANKAFAHLAW